MNDPTMIQSEPGSEWPRWIYPNGPEGGGGVVVMNADEETAQRHAWDNPGAPPLAKRDPDLEAERAMEETAAAAVKAAEDEGADANADDEEEAASAAAVAAATQGRRKGR